jgi:hypothetical protein
MNPKSFDKKMTTVRKIVPLTKDAIPTVPSQVMFFSLQYLYAFKYSVKTERWSDEITMVEHERLFKQVLPVLNSKLEEIKLNGYEGIAIEDLWNFCLQKKWRKKNLAEIRIHEVVSTIFSLRASEIVSHLQIQQFQSTNWFSELNQDELKELLNPAKYNNSDTENN